MNSALMEKPHLPTLLASTKSITILQFNGTELFGSAEAYRSRISLPDIFAESLS